MKSAHTITSTSQPERSLTDIVDTVIEEAKGDLVRASVLLERWARADAEIFALICGPHIQKACWEVIRQYGHREREYLWVPPRADFQSQKGGRVKYLAAAHLDSLFDFRLPIRGLPKLGDCTREQVVEAVDFYMKHATDMRKKGEFLTLVLNALANHSKKPVREQLTNAQLQKFKEKVQI